MVIIKWGRWHWILHREREHFLPGAMVKSLMTRLIVFGCFFQVLLLWNGLGHCGEAPAHGELQDMGERFGRFMGSFMQEMGKSGAKRDAGVTGGVDGNRGSAGASDGRYAPQADERRYGPVEGNGRNVYRYRTPVPMYDPWGANQWGYWNSPLMEYDPWGSSSSHADWDWERRRNYYGSGAIAPWEHDPGGWAGPEGGDWRFGRDGSPVNPNMGAPDHGLGGDRSYGPPRGWEERPWGNGGYGDWDGGRW